MQDNEIVELYWQRDESAIHETEKKYSRYLLKIAYNILSDWEDSRECVNDTYLGAWNTIPPQKPGVLSSYLGKIARRSAIDILRKKTCGRRRASEYAISLSELDECLPAGNITEQNADVHLLAEAINKYLRTLPVEARDIFIGRYYYSDSIREVASYYRMSESKVKSMLYRIRIGLRAYLEEEGFL